MQDLVESARSGLDVLEQRVRTELEFLKYPEHPWVPALFMADIEHHYRVMMDYQTPEFPLTFARDRMPSKTCSPGLMD